MDTLQKQVSILSSKVDALYQLIEQMSDRVSEVVSECRFGADQVQRLETGTPALYRSYQGYGGVDASMEHKDVLLDTSHSDAAGHGSDRPLSSEIQIQRLTAQLTAAYNRIAALEEQLLSHRIH